MACNIQNKIVTSDLLLCYDSADKKSYPGSGNTWLDRSGNSNSGTLTGGPVYSDANYGTLTFDGVDDSVLITCPQVVGKSTITVEMFTTWLSLNNRMFVSSGTVTGTYYSVWTSSFNFGYNTGTGNIIGIPSTTTTALQLVGKPHLYTFVMNSSGNLTSNKIYVDGVSVGSLSVVLGSDATCPAFSSNWRLLNFVTSGTAANHAIGSFRIYGRELSVDEIQQNYNAAKSRFGIT